MKTNFLIIIALMFPVLCLNAGNKTDSLVKRLKICTTDTCTINTLNKLANTFLKDDDVKNAESNARQAYEKASGIGYGAGIAESINYLGKIDKRNGDYDQALLKYEKSLRLFEEIKDTVWISRNLNNIGEIYVKWSQYDKAVSYYLKALSLKQNSRDKKGEGITLNSIGLVLLRAGKHEEAVRYFQDALKIFEKTGNKDLMASTYNNLGNLYQNSSIGKDTAKLFKALDFFTSALDIFKAAGKKREKADLLNNIGNIYAQLADRVKFNLKLAGNETKIKNMFRAYIEKSILYYNESLNDRKEMNDKTGIAGSYINIGGAYSDFGVALKDLAMLHKAQDYIQDALVINRELNNPTEISITLYYLSQNCFYLKQYDKAIQFLEESISTAKEINVRNTILKGYELFTNIYDSTGNYKKALLYSRMFSEIKDSITNEASVKAIQEMQTKYETEKKETQIKLLGSEKLLQETQIRQQRIIIMAFIGGFIIILIFSIIIYRQYREKKKANILLAQQNEEINQQKEEISAQRDEITVQKEIAEKQRDYITDQKKEIDDSIRYAKRIQQAVLPQVENVSAYIQDMFIMIRPKDVVSGDFYFIKYIERSGVLLAAAADCTGHGVPGAFMSMLGVTFLNEICLKPEIQHAGEVLNELRLYIINSLHQTGKLGEQKDGMDISLVAIYREKNYLEYAGANNPLYLIRNNLLSEYKGDKMPIGIHDRVNESFTNHTIEVRKDDCIYLFSDGFADQFGGIKGKKYMYKKFKEFLTGIHGKPMAEQKIITEEESVSWRGRFEQIDDQLIIGIRI